MKHDIAWPSLNRLRSTNGTWLLDALVGVAYLGAVDVLIVSLPDESVVRGVAVLPLLFFLPGYAIVAALFPHRTDRERVETDRRRSMWRGAQRGERRSAVGWLERVVLSVGTSVAVLAVLGVGVAAVGADLTAEWLVLACLEGVSVLGLAVALVARLRLPPSERFHVPVRSVVNDAASALSAPRPLQDRVLSVVVLVLVLASVGTLATAVVSPPSGGQYSTLLVLTENESGEYVAGNYPSNLTRGEEASLVVGVENHEGTAMEYTVVPVLQSVDRSGGSLSVLEEQRMAPIEVQLGANETTYVDHSFEPSMAGSDLRIAYLLYDDAPPEDPSVDSAYRYVHLWVDVSEGAG